MSLITRCPACGTMFKVVPDQLRISDGWVRCGHCAEVFDAQAQMMREEDIPSSAHDDGGPVTIMPDLQRESPLDDFASSIHTEIGESEFPLSHDSAELEAHAHALREDPLDRPFELHLRNDADPADESRPALVSRPVPLEAEPELDDLSFVRQARRRAFWSGRAMRAVLSVVALLLVLLFVLQVAVDRRDVLSAMNPALRPWLATLCQPLRCRISPPRQIDAIAIDSSTFSKLRDAAYRLNVTLRNQAANEVAMPALELTLTDAQDQPLVRKVLLAGDFAPRTPAIGANAEWSTSLALAIGGNGIAPRIAGYRVLAFYP